MTTELKVEQRELGDVAVLVLRGEVDLATVPTLRSFVVDALQGHDRVVLDVADVRFFDSTGLGVLVSTYHRLQERGGEFVLAAPQGAVREVLEMTGIDGYVPVRDSLDDALASVAPEREQR